MTDKLTQTGSQASQELSHSLCQEQTIINGVDVGGCKYLNTFSDCDGYHYYCDLADDIKNEYCEHYRDCYFKQLARKTQLSIEQSKELIRLRQELKESTVKNKNLKQECEELKEKYEEIKEDRYNLNMEMYTLDRYRTALEKVEGMLQAIVETNKVYPLQSNLYKTLNIISKVKGGKNES